MKPIVWTIAGSDGSGGAGIQTDLRVLHQLGVQACSVLTAVTAQHSQLLADMHFLPADFVATQLQILQTEFPPTTIKIGMVGDHALLNVISQFLSQTNCATVLDPILGSSSGKTLFNNPNYVTALKKFLATMDVITPNLAETEILTQHPIKTHDDIEHAAQRLIGMGIKNVIIKGGHQVADNFSQDYWTNGIEHVWLANIRQPIANCRGTGCTFSSALAAAIALGHDIKDALVIAKMYVNRGIRQATPISSLGTHIHHAAWPEENADLPYLSISPLQKLPAVFARCDAKPLGLYPIVDNSVAVKKMLAAGVTTIQLRIKNKNAQQVEAEIATSIQLANTYQARLFVNDYWQLALKHHAYGVHLGQADLATADCNALRSAGIRLGISTHCYSEVAHAHYYRPSYIACGPIFPTTSKVMPFAPQGITTLSRWRATLSQYPIVAIGGIHRHNIADVIRTNVSGIAMISAIQHDGVEFYLRATHALTD